VGWRREFFSLLCRQEEKLFSFKIKKKKKKPRQIIATQKRKKMKKGVVAAAALCKERNKIFARNKGPKIQNKNCDKISEKRTREKSTRKLYTSGKSAKSASRNPHKIQRRREGPPNK